MGPMLKTKVNGNPRVRSLNFSFVLLIVQSIIILNYSTAVSSEGSTTRFNMTVINQVCGLRMISEPSGRIVGGTKTTFGKYPWMIAMLHDTNDPNKPHQSCGAALLTEIWAVTAAHCLDGINLAKTFLRLGDLELSNRNEPHSHVDRRIKSTITHPKYNSRSKKNDIALVRMEKPVEFYGHILPVCLPQDDNQYVGKIAYVTGWGKIHDQGSKQDALREVAVPVISNIACDIFEDGGLSLGISNATLCAGGPGIDACTGDSGGPLVTRRDEDGKFVLIGVTSWGIGCGDEDFFGMYTRVSAVRDWIVKNIYK